MKKEQYDREKKWKGDERKRGKRVRALKKLLGIGAALLAVVGAGAFALRNIDFRSVSAEQNAVLATNGIHWHPRLSIKISDEEQEIPAGIGLGVRERPMHTHDADGIIHLEFQGRVTADQVRLGRFFELWGKTFNKDCIFDKCAGPEGNVRMFVNGQENFDFEKYIMKDGDRIEIRYGK